MSDPDRLAEIRTWRLLVRPFPAPEERIWVDTPVQDIDWLIERAKLAFELGDLLPRKELTITRLRDLLARLEWRGPSLSEAGVCPICDASPAEGHDSTCELAAALHPENDEAAAPKDGGS